MSDTRRANALLSNTDWSFPIPIRFGPGRIAELGEYCAWNEIRNALIVTDRWSRDLPFVTQVQQILAEAAVESEVFSDVSPNPTDEDIAAGRATFREGRFDGIIAIGGGSGMDAGKAISLVALNELDLWQFDFDADHAPALSAYDFPKLICIPTTAGTGAETESTAMVTDLMRGVKRCVWHQAHKPSAAWLDPELTLGLPPHLTAWTGVDAYVHAVEALCVPDWNPLCDGAALEALRLIGRWLPLAVRDGRNLEARAGMLAGSCLAGVAFTKGLGLTHAMSHMVGAVHDTHHGLTNALLLPGVLRFNETAIQRESVLISQALELPEHHFDAFYNHTVRLLSELQIPATLAEIGVEEDRLEEIADKALGDAACATNPVEASALDIEQLLVEAMEDAR